MMDVTANGYFSGAGLMELGLSRAGVTVQQSFEIDPVCCETQRRNFAHEVVTCDLRTKLVKDQRRALVNVFTYPCDRYSRGAAIHSVQTGDELFLHALRHMVIQPPEVYVCENVPGLRKFPVVMEVMTQLPDYYVHVFCPVQAHAWLPQRRDRLIILGSRRPFAWRPPEATRAVTLREILETDPQVHIPAYVYRRLRGRYRDKPIISDPARGDIAPTCVAHYAKDLSTRLVADKRFKHGVRPYSVREYARLQGVPDSFKFAGTEPEQYRQIGNGVAVPMGEWAGREVMRYFGRAA